MQCNLLSAITFSRDNNYYYLYIKNMVAVYFNNKSINIIY